MEHSLLLAKIMGPTLLVLGLGFLVNPDHFRKMIKDFIKSEGLMFMASFCSLILGMIVVSMHNVWTTPWQAIISLLGWMTLVKGIVVALLPKQTHHLAKMAKNSGSYMIASLIWVVLGAYLCYVAFLMM